MVVEVEMVVDGGWSEKARFREDEAGSEFRRRRAHSASRSRLAARQCSSLSLHDEEVAGMILGTHSTWLAGRL